MKFNIPSNLRLGALIYNKKVIVSLSVLISFVLWLVITINQNPIRQQTFTNISANISVENTAVADLGLGIVSDVSSQNYTVTVSGPNYIVSSLKPEDFLLSASVTDVNAPGTYTLEIFGASNSNKTGYTFSSISPSTIDVTFDYIDTKEFTVVPKIIGVSASTGLVAESPVMADAGQNTITIKGPRTTINKIATVGTLTEVNKTLETSQTYDSDVVLYDANDVVLYRYNSDGKVYNANGDLVTDSNLSLSFTTAKVTQPISKKATVKCIPVFNNLPIGLTEKDISYTIDHEEVTIIGAPDVVNKISEISLSAIDFRNVSTTSNKFEVSAVLPDGVKILESVEYFNVTINLSNYTEKTFEIKSIRCTGLNSSLSAKTDSVIRNVKICGPKKVINSLKTSDLYAVVDLTDKSEGDHTVDVIIKSDIYDDIWQIGSYSTSISIK